MSLLTKMDTSDLKEIINTCKSNGIRRLKMGDLELSFDAEPEPEPDATRNSPVNREPKLGADGLTAAEQAELYGKPIDAEA